MCIKNISLQSFSHNPLTLKSSCMCRGTRTLSRKTIANLDCAFVTNVLVLLVWKIGKGPLAPRFLTPPCCLGMWSSNDEKGQVEIVKRSPFNCLLAGGAAPICVCYYNTIITTFANWLVTSSSGH